MSLIAEQLTAMAISAAHKSPELMTEGEKLAIAFAAGCQVITEVDGTTVRITTRNPIGIAHDGRRLIVCEGVGKART